MSDCYKCGYRARIPGDAHSSCRFDFLGQRIPMPKGKPHGIRQGWWMHPANFDPIWMEGSCGGFSDASDPAKTVSVDDPFTVLMSLFGNRH